MFRVLGVRPSQLGSSPEQRTLEADRTGFRAMSGKWQRKERKSTVNGMSGARREGIRQLIQPAGLIGDVKRLPGPGIEQLAAKMAGKQQPAGDDRDRPGEDHESFAVIVES